MARVAVIGAGAMGLAAAYRAAKDGHEVDLLEAAPELGGMAGHFDFDGVSLERFYHFVCKSDYPTNPPFTPRQLEALVTPDVFEVIDWPRISTSVLRHCRMH